MRCLTITLSFCLMTGSINASGNDPYGLLFTSPAQRAQLDNRFNGNHAGESDAGATAATQPASPSLKLNGTVVSSTGRKAAWINGQRHLSGSRGSAADVRVIGPDNVQVRTAPSATLRTMKPGQVMDAATGQISEAYAKASGNQGL